MIRLTQHSGLVGREPSPFMTWKKNRLLNSYLMRVCLPAKYSSLCVGLSHAVIVHSSTSSFFLQTYSHTVYVKATKQSAIWLFLTHRRNWQNWWHHFLHFLLDTDVTTQNKRCPCEEVPLSYGQRLWSSNRGFLLDQLDSKTSKPSNHATWDDFFGWENLTLVPVWFSGAAFLNTFLMSNV